MWKVVRDYPNYMVSSDGTILSSARKNSPFAMLSEHIDKDGYAHVTLSANGVRKRHSVHRLVAQAFLLKDHPRRSVVNHINSIRNDNRVQNLEWVTVQENNKHGVKHGFLSQKGENNKNRKLDNKQVLAIRERLKSGEMYIDIAPDYNVTATTIGRIARKESWSHI
jgi:hypothetical protein